MMKFSNLFHAVARTTLALIVAIALVSCSEDKSAMVTLAKDAPKPNVVWITLDTCRADFACYGYDRAVSPNIDRLAKRGAIFKQHFSQATWTIPSVSSYMTGRYFPRDSIGGYGQSFRLEVGLPLEGEIMAPEIFAANGYESLMVGWASLWFTEKQPLPHAFDAFVGVNSRGPDRASFEQLNEVALPFLRRERDRPFFLYIHAFDNHFPHYLEAPYDRWLPEGYPADRISQHNSLGAVRKDGKEFDAEDQAYLRGLYDGSMLYADEQIGALLEELERQGLTENTLIVITSDHGEALAENGTTVAHGGNLTYDEVTRVPLVIAGPGVRPGIEVNAFTENVDVLPTLVDLLGLDSDLKADGASLLRLLDNPTGPAPRPYAFTFCREEPLMSLRSDRFRVEYNPETDDVAAYRAPDGVATRQPVGADDPAIQEMLGYLEDEIVPRYARHQERPLMGIFMGQARRPDDGDSAEQVIEVPTRRAILGEGLHDDRWSHFASYYFAAPFSESVPPLEFRTRVEPGRYHLAVELFCSADFGGNAGSSIEVKAGRDEAFREIRFEAEGDSAEGFVVHRLGTYEIAGTLFRATVRPGDAAMWAGFGNLVLIPDEAASLDAFEQLFQVRSEGLDEVSDRYENLKSLGYLE